MTKLYDLASTIRSKNAGVNQITFDIIFPNAESYQRVLASKAITKDSIAKLFGIPLSRISDFVDVRRRPTRSSSRCIACARAAAPATGTSSAASSTARCSRSRSRIRWRACASSARSEGAAIQTIARGVCGTKCTRNYRF